MMILDVKYIYLTNNGKFVMDIIQYFYKKYFVEVNNKILFRE